MLAMTGRNIKLFFRDKSTVFFSLLSVLIIIALYALFLGDTYKNGLENVKGIDFLINSWVIAGILAVVSVTATMGAFGAMVEDRSKKILKDFYATPVKRSEIAGGYILSAFAVGVLMSLITLLLGEIYIFIAGGELLELLAAAGLLGLIVLSVLSSSAMVFFIVTFFKSQNAFATASTIIGTLIGFLTGVYIPIGSLPEWVQLIIKLFPLSHAGALIRQLLLKQPMAVSFAGAPAAAVEKFNHSMGVVLQFNRSDVDPMTSVIVLLVTTVLFYGLAVLNISRKIKIS